MLALATPIYENKLRYNEVVNMQNQKCTHVFINNCFYTKGSKSTPNNGKTTPNCTKSIESGTELKKEEKKTQKISDEIFKNANGQW